MNREIVISIMLFFAAQSLMIVSAFLLFVMITEVNQKLPEGQKISFLGWHSGKYRRVVAEYRRLYPCGRLNVCSWLAFFAGLVFAVCCAWRLGFLG